MSKHSPTRQALKTCLIPLDVSGVRMGFGVGRRRSLGHVTVKWIYGSLATVEVQKPGKVCMAVGLEQGSEYEHDSVAPLCPRLTDTVRVPIAPAKWWG